MESISFDPIAPVYDATRVFNEAKFNEALDYIAARFPPAKHPKLFEPGIGTGRIAIPFAERGYDVTGADISGEMLKVLAGKLAAVKPPLPVTYIQGDITSLPFPGASFNIAVAVHVFHLVPEWKKAVDEVLRILTPDAPLVLLYTGSGFEIPWVHDKYRELCMNMGYSAEHIGTARTQLQAYIEQAGWRIETVEGRWQWMTKVQTGKSLNQIKLHYHGMTQLVPPGVHDEVIIKLEKEVLEKYGSLDAEIEIPNQVRLVIITRR